MSSRASVYSSRMRLDVCFANRTERETTGKVVRTRNENVDTYLGVQMREVLLQDLLADAPCSLRLSFLVPLATTCTTISGVVNRRHGAAPLSRIIDDNNGWRPRFLTLPSPLGGRRRRCRGRCRGCQRRGGHVLVVLLLMRLLPWPKRRYRYGRRSPR